MEHEAPRSVEADIRDAGLRVLTQQDLVARRCEVAVGVDVVVGENNPAAGKAVGARRRQACGGRAGSDPAHDDRAGTRNGFGAGHAERTGEGVDGVRNAPLVDEPRHRRRGDADQDGHDDERDQQLNGCEATLKARLSRIEASRAHEAE